MKESSVRSGIDAAPNGYVGKLERSFRVLSERALLASQHRIEREEQPARIISPSPNVQVIVPGFTRTVSRHRAVESLLEEHWRRIIDDWRRTARPAKPWRSV